MARPLKQGLDYFPLDVQIFNDRKIRRLLKSNGSCSMAVFLCLLCHIYSENGYYILYNEDLIFDIADQLGLEVIDVNNVVNDCINCGLFNKMLFDRENILTSEAIQRRFKSATLKRKDIVINGNYSVNDVNNSINDVNNPAASELMTTEVHKVKKSKVNKSNISPNGDSEPEQPDSLTWDRIDYNKIKNLYHSVCVSYPKIQAITDGRKKKIKSRIKDFKSIFPDRSYMEVLQTIFEKIENTAFCRGENSRGWIVTFDWIFENDRNFMKVIEGNYNENKKLASNETKDDEEYLQ